MNIFKKYKEKRKYNEDVLKNMSDTEYLKYMSEVIIFNQTRNKLLITEYAKWIFNLILGYFIILLLLIGMNTEYSLTILDILLQFVKPFINIILLFIFAIYMIDFFSMIDNIKKSKQLKKRYGLK